MRKHTDQRERTLLLTKILLEETDPRHPLPLARLMERLDEEGAPAERKSVYRDLAALQKHGLAVVYQRGKGWYVAERRFSLEDVGRLADAVAVYPHLSGAQRQALLDKLQGLVCAHQRPRLCRPVSLPPKAEERAEAVQNVLERIHTACQEGKALSFVPHDYNEALEWVPVGPRQLISPKGLLWTGTAHRLLAWDHRGEELRLVRPDRMDQVTVTGAPAQGPAADASLWTALPFGPDPGRREQIKLRCAPELAGEVADRFGPQVQTVPLEKGFLLTADVVLSQDFWTWMHAHREQADLLAPPLAAQRWREQTHPRQAWAG